MSESTSEELLKKAWIVNYTQEGMTRDTEITRSDGSTEGWHVIDLGRKRRELQRLEREAGWGGGGHYVDG